MKNPEPTVFSLTFQLCIDVQVIFVALKLIEFYSFEYTKFRRKKAEKYARKVLTNVTHEYMQHMNTPNFWGLPCSYADNFLMSDEQDPEDNFSPKMTF